MSARRTVPVDGDSEFLSLAQKIDDLLALGGHRRREHAGSASWLGIAGSNWSKETCFKLTFYGPGDMAFGVRRDFVEKNAPKLAKQSWPYSFRVPPRTEAEFVGFLVRDDKDSIKRIDRVLVGLGILLDKAEGGARPADHETRKKQFDEALDKLGL